MSTVLHDLASVPADMVSISLRLRIRWIEEKGKKTASKLAEGYMEEKRTRDTLISKFFVFVDISCHDGRENQSQKILAQLRISSEKADWEKQSELEIVFQ